MMDFQKFQRDIYDNKVAKGFNVTNVEQEFCFLHEEVSEAYRAYRKKLPDLGEELADVAIYLFGLAQILGIDLEQEILRKMEKNKNRTYRDVDGVLTRIEDEKEKPPVP